MATVSVQQRRLDARPDRIDFRDRIYQPALESLPDEYPSRQVVKEHLQAYVNAGLIRDQGQEGACTGFGLACAINYLCWVKYLRQFNDRSSDAPPPQKLYDVSPRMLYHLARFYDEWAGEDYEGSSCRGAMKGWHRHGVCAEAKWRYNAARFVPPEHGWQQDAALRPIGAYYRVNKDSITDLQAAICEVGAVYVSSQVHKGWDLGKKSRLTEIGRRRDDITGGHAFAMVGFRREGFIIQNSWGPNWGYFGFAILPYPDWVRHGMDAWVAVMGAPVEGEASRIHTSQDLARDVMQRRAGLWFVPPARPVYRYQNKEVKPWCREQALRHTVVMGNNGTPLNRFLDCRDAASCVKHVAYQQPLEWFSQTRSRKIAIYAHGGLNNEDASIDRIRVMAPYFKQNGIYPLFLTWRTGLGESMRGIVSDHFRGTEPAAMERATWRPWEDLKKGLSEARDRAIEKIGSVGIKPLWTQMKQNAAAGASVGGGLTLLAAHLAALKREVGGLEIHLVGHSAGSILLGYLLKLLARRKLAATSCTLYAPACTVDFAWRYYRPAIQNKTLARNDMHLEILSDERELADHVDLKVASYGKSLLYLVSRALEDGHKTPLLGLERAWDKNTPAESWCPCGAKDIRRWLDFWKNGPRPKVSDQRRAEVCDGQGTIRLAHGSFDNDVEVVTRTLRTYILGRRLKYPVENLRGF